jgi:hypothetical protein
MTGVTCRGIVILTPWNADLGQKAIPTESLPSLRSQSEGRNTLLGLDWACQTSAMSKLKA